MGWKAAVLGLAALAGAALGGGGAWAGTPAQWKTCTSGGTRDIPPDTVIAACNAFVTPSARKRADLAQALGERGYAYWRKSDLTAAETDFRAALTIDPGREPERMWLASVLLQRAARPEVYPDKARRWALAREALELLDRLHADIEHVSAEVERLTATAYDYLGQREAAIHYAGRAIALDPDHADDFNTRCFDRVILRVGLLYALSDCDRAIALMPKVAEFRDSRGWALLALGRPAEAAAEFTAGLTLNPNQASSLLGRSLAETALGRPAEAAADLAAARALDADVAEPYEAGPKDQFDFGPGLTEAFAAACLNAHGTPDEILAAAQAAGWTAGWKDAGENGPARDGAAPGAMAQITAILGPMPRFVRKPLGPGELMMRAGTDEEAAAPGHQSFKQSCWVSFMASGLFPPPGTAPADIWPATADLGGRAADLLGHAPTAEMKGIAVWIWQDGPAGRRFLTVGADFSFVDFDPALPLYSLGYAVAEGPDSLMLMRVAPPGIAPGGGK